MSKLKNKTFDKIDINGLKYIPYLCDDMSVKYNEKNYTKCNQKKCIKDNLNFGYLQLYLNKDTQLYITTPPMKCLFGIQKNG